LEDARPFGLPDEKTAGDFSITRFHVGDEHTESHRHRSRPGTGTSFAGPDGHVHKLIIASEYREKMPTFASGKQDWSERSVCELTRIPDKKQAARVAEKSVKAVEIDSDETSLIFASDFPTID